MTAPVLTRHRGGLLAAALALVAAVAVVLVVAAFTSDRTKSPLLGAVGTGASKAPVAASTTPPIPKVKVALVGAAKGSQSWKQPVRVKVNHGTLLSVKATDDTGAALDGTLTSSAWVSTGQVVPARSYQLQAYVRGLDGVSAFHTLKVSTTAASSLIYTRVTLQQGKAVGIGWPVVVKFTAPVADRTAVQKALTVTSSPAVIGAWHWFSDTEVHFRPQAYWPAHTQITLHRSLDGVQAAPGVWGAPANDVAFNVGDAHITTVDNATHHMVVTVNGTVVANDPVSTGRPSLPTLGGVHIVLEKFAVKEMRSSTLIPPIPEFLPGHKKNPAYYDEKELWSTRISNAGAFVHYQPGTLKQQGHSNASHGCVNTNLGAAERFYNLSLLGDIVNVVNSPALPNQNDPGMQDWNYSWDQWLAGSATGA